MPDAEARRRHLQRSKAKRTKRDTLLSRYRVLARVVMFRTRLASGDKAWARPSKLCSCNGRTKISMAVTVTMLQSSSSWTIPDPYGVSLQEHVLRTSSP